MVIEATYPFEMFFIDFCHLDRAKEGYEYVLAVYVNLLDSYRLMGQRISLQKQQLVTCLMNVLYNLGFQMYSTWQGERI